MRKTLITLSTLLITLSLILGACGPEAESPPTEPTSPTEPTPPAPADFELISLDVEPAEVAIGETVSVMVLVENTGGSEGTYTAILTVDGVTIETKEATIVPGSSGAVNFSLVKDAAGTYEIGVGDLSADLTVNEELEPIPADTWTLSAPLYLLGVIGGETFMELLSYQESWGLSFGFEGSSSFDDLCQQISEYWDGIQESNTIIVLSTSLEGLQRLSEWPEQYKEVFPFSVEELEALDLPFALLERQDNGLIRAIILVDNEPDIVTFVTAVKDNQVPVGIPWTLTNGEVTVIEED
jgi:hypothetical protein